MPVPQENPEKFVTTGHPYRRWLAALPIALWVSGPVWADSVEDAETLVRQVYFEGLPAAPAEALDGAAVAHLVDLLQDPTEAAYHGNIALALGLRAHPAAFPALSAFVQTPLVGEVDRSTFRARIQALLALGHLARRDPRALRFLLDDPLGDDPPDWHFRQHRGPALRALLDEQVLTALALSGAPAAAQRLDRAIAAARGDDVASLRRQRHARACRERWEQRAAGAVPGRGAGP